MKNSNQKGANIRTDQIRELEEVIARSLMDTGNFGNPPAAQLAIQELDETTIDERDKGLLVIYRI